MPERLLALTLKSDIDEIPRLSTALHALMEDHGFPEEDILDTQLAVEEAVTNVIMHGYKGGSGEVLVLCKADVGIIEIRLEDRAVPFNPLTLPAPDLGGDIEDRKIGGLGFFLIRQVMDEILYRYEDGKNILTMIKRKTN
ncbi:MAG: ATP-binding protein [Methanoregula sp.]|jgi:serine/threonine-protein kinase RsbW|uniref:ATP-binding protein n=1 Tax=Methanoregula sp. TaxID=2052170 RepID=UPI0025ED91C8|nr:ATP-binding protein [Methanoregula sp.]MCK9631251.1 ATP-binding protein [Methanoregula sp.]